LLIFVLNHISKSSVNFGGSAVRLLAVLFLYCLVAARLPLYSLAGCSRFHLDLEME